MRKARVLKKDKSYFILVKVNRGECIFKADVLKYIMLNTIERANNKFRFEIHNFCISENKVHFMLKPLGLENLSKIMHWILSVSAMAYNRKMGIHGHVWQDRFKSQIIETMNDYLNKFVFIAKLSLKHNEVCIWDNQFSAIFYIMKGIYSLVIKPPANFLFSYHSGLTLKLFALFEIWL